MAKKRTAKTKAPAYVTKAKKAQNAEAEPTDAKKWLDRIKRAVAIRDQWRKDFRVGLAYEYFDGRQRPSWIPEKEWLTINMIYSTVLAMLPTLYNTDPYFYIRLRRSFNPNPMTIALYEQRGKVRQAMLNYLIQELKLKPKARLCVQDAFFQYAVLKVIHTGDLEANPNAGEPLLDEDTNLPMGNLVEPDFLPVNERYGLVRLHPDDYVVDEDAGPLDDDVNWKAQRIKKPLEEAKKDEKYRASARKNLKATEVKEDAQKDREQRKKGAAMKGDEDTKEPDTVVIWEVFNLRAKQMLVVSEGCDEYLIEPDDVPTGIERDPFIDLRFTLRDDSWYPIPPVSQWLDSQREYCEARSKVMVHRKRFNRKYELDSAAYSDDAEGQAAKLQNGDDGTVLIKEGTPGMPGVHPIKDAPLDMQVHTELAYLRKDFEDLAIGANQRGGTAGIESATEAGILEVRAKMREGDWLGLVVDFLRDTGRKLDQQVQANITQDEAIKVAGPQGEYWELVRVDDYGEIAGEFEYSINVGAMTPQIPEIERAQWLAFLGVIGANPHLALSEELLKKTAQDHHIDNEILIKQLMDIAQKLMTGQIQPPGAGGQGSQANVSNFNPVAAMGGAAMGMANVRGGQ